MNSAALPKDRTWELPPLILHPFSDPSGPDKLVESSRAHLMLQGLLPSGGLAPAEIERRLLDGRYCEIRMLYYVGRDLDRWVEQCMEIVERDETLQSANIRTGSFASLLVESAPQEVREKLSRWGVVDYKAIFMRAFGLNAMFAEVPARELLAPSFLRYYYRYADQLFHARQQSEPFVTLDGRNFTFDLYASGEYSRLLEKEWERS
jgi:hypothetical protein